MIRTISVVITLILGCACYVVSGGFAGKGSWRDALMFGALGCVLLNLVSMQGERGRVSETDTESGGHS